MKRRPVPAPVKAIMPNMVAVRSLHSAQPSTPMPTASTTEPSINGTHVFRGATLLKNMER